MGWGGWDGVWWDAWDGVGWDGMDGELDGMDWLNGMHRMHRKNGMEGY